MNGVRDVILFTVVFASAAAGVLVPELGVPFQPVLVYFMMTLLFLSFLRIDFSVLLNTSGPMITRLAGLVAMKLLVLPAGLYYLTKLVLPDYAVPVLLLSGISTGVVAPFIATLVGADVPFVLRMVIVSSVLVPFTLPVLVKALAGAEIVIPLEVMMRLLAMVIFIPMAAVILLRRCRPSVIERIVSAQYVVSVTFFGIINLGVFSKYSDFFFRNPVELVVSVALAYALSAVYFATGLLLGRGAGLSERLAASVGLGIMNNVLVIVFSSKYFGPLSPTLAAMYMFPFFTMIVPLRLAASRLESKQTTASPDT
ncbi:MAG: bile acid:sodium symporter [Pseudomonadota bacterium]